MKKPVLICTLFAGAVLAAGSAQAQGAITDGGVYKMTHYGVMADGSAAQFGVPAGTALCMDVDSNLATAGTSIGQWGDNGIDAQRFVFTLQPDGSYKIRHLGTVMYVQPVALNKAQGTRIEQNVLVSANDDAQRWFVTDPNNNGRYKLTLKNSTNAQNVSQVLEVGFASAAPGARVNLYDDNNFEPAQRWVLTRTAIVSATRNAAGSTLWLQAFPNPLAPGQGLSLRVEAQRKGAAEVEVLDVMGRRVHSQTAELLVGGNPLALTNAPLAPGLYLVRVHQGTFVQQTQVVQQ